MKPVFVALGFLCLALGAAGVVLPVLPTVPFLLAASFFFAKGSRHINDWFMATGLYQKHLKDFAESHAMTLKAKVVILAVASGILIPAAILVKPLYAKILILAAITLKYCYFIFRIKTIKKDTSKTEKPVPAIDVVQDGPQKLD